MSLTFVACVETPKSEIEKQAIETLKKSILEDSKDATIDNIKSVFSSKNLCILHADISGVKGTNKVEYLFLTLDDKNYEAFQDLNDDSVFVSESTFNKICKGTIYEHQDYATAILFRSVIYMNFNGWEVGNHNTDFFINSPLKTGLWELCGTADIFGDLTGGKCLRLIGKGTYSTQYENDNKLIALLFVYDNGYANFVLLEDGSRKVDDFDGHIKIKDGKGDVHDIYFTDKQSGVIVPYWDKKDSYQGEGKFEFKELLEKEGILSALAEVGGRLFSSSSKCTYRFKFHLGGLKNAMRFFQSSGYIESDNDDLDYDNNSEYIDEELEVDNESMIAEEVDLSVEDLETEDKVLDSRDNKSMNIESDETPKVFDVCEQMPQFPRGDQALMDYLNKSIHYPVEAEENGVQGRVVCSFVIETDGSISDVHVVRSVDPSLDKEAKRVISSMPRWIPGKQSGTPVRVKYSLPVIFKLQ